MTNEMKPLIGFALKSKLIKGSPHLRKLLKLLGDCFPESVYAVDIWDAVFGGETDLRRRPDPEKIRETVYRLRITLKEIPLPPEGDRHFWIPYAQEPDSQGRRSYRLELVTKRQMLTHVFWRPHTRTENDNVKLIYDEPIFYYDIVHLCFFRYFDTNPESVSGANAVSELEKLHGKELKNFISGSLEERLRPSRLYVGIGEMEAMNALALWFSRESFLPVIREASNRGGSLVGSCPILLGSERTNLAMKRFWKSKESQKFAFRLHPKRFAFVSIRKPKTEESCEFDGFIVEEDGESTAVGLNATISQARERLVIVTRSQSPDGKGWTTIISSDTTLALREVVFALVDERMLGDILARAQINTEDLREAFEMLFSVEVAPSGDEHETGVAKLRCFRKY
jgi:hypothetical protein